MPQSTEGYDFENTSSHSSSQEEKKILPLEKIHVLPVKSEGQTKVIISKLKKFMQQRVILFKYMHIQLNGTKLKITKNISTDEIVKNDTLLEVKNNNKSLTSQHSNSKNNSCVYGTQTGEYIVVACFPSRGYITPETKIYTDGGPVSELFKVQFFVIESSEFNYEQLKQQDSDCYFRMVSPRIEDNCLSLDVKKQIVSSSKQSSVCKNASKTIISGGVKSKKQYRVKKKSKFKSGFDPDSDSYQSSINNGNKLENHICKIFYECIKPYFMENKSTILYPGKKFCIQGIQILVWYTEPNGNPGFLTRDTDIYITLDKWGEYSKVHIVPFIDTLPSAYNYNLFSDYLKPFIEQNPWRTYLIDDTFYYRGVQFKIVATEPRIARHQGGSRIGSQTLIHYDGAITPSIMDILPYEVLQQIRTLPVRMQPFAIINAASDLQPDAFTRISSNPKDKKGIKNEVLQLIESNLIREFSLQDYIDGYSDFCEMKKKLENKYNLDIIEEPYLKDFTYQSVNKSDMYKTQEPVSSSTKQCCSSNNHSEIGAQEFPICTVCTLELKEGDQSLIFPCGHVFHWLCVKNWLYSSCTCPNCRCDLTNMIEQYVANSNACETESTALKSAIQNLLGNFLKY